MKKNRRHRNRGLQGLALLLSIVLLFVFMPISAVAEVLGQLDVEEEPIVEEIYEVTALREESVKHFYVGEGNYTAVSYGEAVHRLDAVGTWQEIDNTLTLQNGKYQTSDGRVQLAGTAGEDLLQLSEKGYRIGLSFATGGADNTAPYALQSVNTANATVQNVTREPVLEGDSAAVKYEKISKVLNRSGLQYTNLLANTDVAYTLHGNDITGRITLRGQRGSNDVALRLQLTGLVPTLATDGSILLADATTEEVAYTIPAPTASDPNLTASYQLVPVSEGLYLLGITTTLRNHISTEDFGSLATPGSGDTAVTLSFGVVTVSGTVINPGGEICGYIDADYPDVDRRYADEMRFVGNYYSQIGYLMMELPQIPEKATFAGAVLSMWYSQYLPGEEPIDDMDIDSDVCVHKATVAWYEMESWTYEIAGNYTNRGRGQLIDDIWCDSSETYFDFDISSAMQDWYGGEAYHGFAVVCEIPDAPFYLNNMDYRPYITVTYQIESIDVPDGVYYIQNAENGNFLHANTETSSGNVAGSLQSFSRTSAQRWQITDLQNGYFEIESTQQPGWVLTANSSVNADVWLQPRSSTSSVYQQWYFVEYVDEVLIIIARSSYQELFYDDYTLCLGISSAIGADEHDVAMTSTLNDTTTDELWLLHQGSDLTIGHNGDYYFQCATTKMYMTVDSTDDFAEQHDFTGAADQIWRVVYDSSGYYRIYNVTIGKYLTVQASYENKAKVLLESYYSNNTDRQRWKFTQLSNGTWEIQAEYHKGTSLVLAAGQPFLNWEGSIYEEGVNIEQRNDNTRDNWRLCRRLETPNYCQMVHDDDELTGYNWCWVTCAQMAAATYGYTDIAREDAIEEVKGAVVDESGNAQEIEEASEFFAEGDLDFYSVDDGYTLSSLLDLLDNGDPVICGLKYVSSDGGHTIIIRGYYYDGDTVMLQYNDPMVLNAISAKTYSELFENSSTEWEDTIVVRSDYS